MTERPAKRVRAPRAGARRATKKQPRVPLREQAARAKFIEALFDSVPVALALRDPDGRFLFVNRMWERYFDGNRETVLGKTLRELIPAKRAATAGAMDQDALARGPGTELTNEYVQSGRHYTQTRTVMADAEGHVIGVLVASLDTTEKHEQDEALRRSRDEIADRMKFTNDVIDSIPMAVSMRDVDGRYALVNRAWERYYGVPREKAIGAVVRDVLKLSPEQAAPRDALDRAAIEAGPENPLETPDFQYGDRHYTSRRTAMSDAQGRPLGVVLATLDVTERRAMEAALANEQRQLELVVRAAKTGILDWDGTTRTVYYSPRFREMLGYPPDADTSAWPDYFEIIHPDDAQRVLTAFRAHILGKGPGGPSEFHDPIEYRLRCADGRYVWVEGVGVSVRDANGHATRFIASMTDITDRRTQEEALRASRDQIAAQAAQLEHQNEELKESVRLREEVERISRHDIKTPLNSVIAVPRLLREERRLDPEEAELLSIVERAGYRILNMVNLSLDLFKMEQGTYRFRPHVVDLVQLLDTVLADVRSHAASKYVSLRIVHEGRPAGETHTVHAWAEELLCYSILANVLKNAVEASPERETVTITTAARRDAVPDGDGDASARVELSIHNRGVVPEEIRDRFFEKYTTARKSDGLGLGTYSARLMAHVQDGDLTMRTSDADGTTLTLRLRAVPAAEAATGVRAPAQAERADVVTSDEMPALRVMIVDDDEYNRLVVRRYLPSPPLTVETAVNGRAAVDNAVAAPFDVIVMDLDMPVMSGLEAARQLREHERSTGRSPCVIIAFSSHDDDETRRRSQASGCDAYLTKPVTKATLLRTIRELTRSGAGVSIVPAPDGHDGSARETSADDAIDVDPDLKDSVGTFLESRRPALDEMVRALDGSADAPLRRLAHRAAGSFGLYGFRWASDQCRRIEREADTGERARLLELITTLRRHLDMVEIRCDGAALR